jgi:hypothetical protein
VQLFFQAIEKMLTNSKVTELAAHLYSDETLQTHSSPHFEQFCQFFQMTGLVVGDA